MALKLENIANKKIPLHKLETKSVKLFKKEGYETNEFFRQCTSVPKRSIPIK